MYLDQIRNAFEQSSLPYKAELQNLVRRAYTITRDPDDPASQATGVSRFGGLPDLPDEYIWPQWQGRPLQFIAQINLAELPAIPERELLPEKGLLSFFYDAVREASGEFQRERGSFAVAYFDMDGAALTPRTSPDSISDCDLVIPSRISFQICESEPGWEHPLIEQLLPDMEDIIRYNDIAHKGWFRGETHGMLGYPIPVQQPVEFEFEKARLGYWEADEITRVALNQQIYSGRTDWELLLQVRSDENIGLYLPPDEAILYFMIRRSDLVGRNFQNSWMIKQSS